MGGKFDPELVDELFRDLFVFVYFVLCKAINEPALKLPTFFLCTVKPYLLVVVL